MAHIITEKESNKMKQSWQSKIINFFLRKTLKKKLENLEIKDHRRIMKKSDRFVKIPTDIVIKQETIDGINALWIDPPDFDSDLVMLYLHGGGFCMETTKLHQVMASKICRTVKMRALIPAYRLAPEHPFPAGLNDCVATYKTLLDKGYKSHNIVLAGDSAGGALCLSTIAKLREQGLELPACAALMSPASDLTLSGTSHIKNAQKEPLYTLKALEAVANAYVDGQEKNNPYISPYFQDFNDFPPLLFHVGSTEMLLDHSVSCYEKAKNSGVDARITIWENMPHVFQSLGFIPESKLALMQITDFMQTHLTKKIKHSKRVNSHSLKGNA